MIRKVKCFISYSWRQQIFAKAFAAEVRKQPDFDVWIDQEQVFPGQTLFSRLEQGLRSESDCTVSLISPEYLQSENCTTELNDAHNRWIRYRKPLIPVKISKCDLPFRLRDFIYVDLTRAFAAGTDEIDDTLLAEGVLQVCEAIRHQLEPRADLVRFFDAGDGAIVRLVSNKSYTSPYPEKSFSTTARFTSEVEGLLRTLKSRTAISDSSQIHLDYLTDANLEALIDGSDSLISYASSKINPLTDRILRRFESIYHTRLRFVFQDDLIKGLSESMFPDEDKGRRVSLLLKDLTLSYADGRDYGLIVRAPIGPKGTKFCWVAAGCGRPGSSAVYQALFDPTWQHVLWPRLAAKLPTAFYAVIGVEFDAAHSDTPNDPQIVDFQEFT